MNFNKTLNLLLQTSRGKQVLVVCCLTIVCLALLFFSVASSRSLALETYTLLIIFDLLSLVTILINLYTSEKLSSTVHSPYSYGYERCDVLCIFASAVLLQLGSLFMIKESVERLLEQSEVTASPVLPSAASVAFLFHMIIFYGVEKKSLNIVITASSSSWLQEHCADMSHALCRIIPGLSQFLLPRVNPLALLNVLGGFLCWLSYILLESSYSQCHACDSLFAICLAFMTIGTMKPLAIFTGRILLQTSPSYVLPQLDKSMREAGTLDGVLEVADDHFWQLSLNKMAGSVVVRVRRDADEQLVLAHVTDRLYPIVGALTVQVNKDTSWRPVL